MHENREISCTSWSKDQDRSAKAINRTADVNVQEKSDAPRSTLATAGFRVIVAENGAAGLDAFLAAPHEIDLVLTDVLMPD
jgi:hypothetical protein